MSDPSASFEPYRRRLLGLAYRMLGSMADAEDAVQETYLRWHGAERRLWTDVPVRIFRNGAVIDGTALDVKMAEEATTVSGRVHARFERNRQ